MGRVGALPKSIPCFPSLLFSLQSNIKFGIAWYLCVTCLVIPGLLNAQLPILPEGNKYQMTLDTYLNVKKDESFFSFFLQTTTKSEGVYV